MKNETYEIKSAGCLENGKWMLSKDGTLTILLNGLLPKYGSFYFIRFKVLHLVIKGDVTEIEDGAFENYYNLESVDFRMDKLPVIGTDAFAHCPKLQEITIPEGLALSAFDMLFSFGDTPAANRYFGSNDDEENYDSPDWKIFIATLETGITSLTAKHENEPLELEKCLNVICDGCEKNDPIMLFLGARFANYASRANEYLLYGGSQKYSLLYGHCHIPITFSRKLRSFPYQHDFPFFNDDEVKDLYIRAAEAGSLHALLWCAWCYAEGQAPFSANQKKAEDYIKKASILRDKKGEQFHLIDYLRMKELADLFAVQLEWIDDHAHDIDVEEDYNSCFRLTLPDPSWRVLCERIRYLQTFARTLGVTTEVFFDSIYSNARCGFDAYNSETELTWIAWSLNELKTNNTPTVDSASETDDVKTVKRECGTSFVDSNPDTRADLTKNMTESSAVEEKEEQQINDLLSIYIEELDLSVRSYHCLKRANINTVGDLISKTPDEIIKIRVINQRCLEEIEQKLDQMGLHLAGDNKN